MVKQEICQKFVDLTQNDPVTQKKMENSNINHDLI